MGAKESSDEQDDVSSAASLKLPVKKIDRKETPVKATSPDKREKLNKKQAKQFDKNIEFLVATFLDGEASVKRPVYGDKETFEEFVQTVHKESLINTLRTALKENGIGNNAGKTKESAIKALMNFKLSENVEDDD